MKDKGLVTLAEVFTTWSTTGSQNAAVKIALANFDAFQADVLQLPTIKIYAQEQQMSDDINDKVSKIITAINLMSQKSEQESEK